MSKNHTEKAASAPKYLPLYYSYLDQLQLLTPQQVGLLTLALLRRGRDGVEPEFPAGSAVGTVEENTESGIFGTVTDASVYQPLDAVPVADAADIHTGAAEILSNVEGDTVQSYSVEVIKVYPADDAYGRSMLLRVTDPDLLDKTGGIVQGMSGSPVLQDGKLIGAVTHVLVDDPTCGYAISIERMLEEMTN